MQINGFEIEQEKKFLAEFAEKQYEGAEDNLGTATPFTSSNELKRFVEDCSF